MIVTKSDIEKILSEELDRVFEEKRKILNEQSTTRGQRSDFAEYDENYKVYFASRALGPDWSPVHHAWVMLLGPDGITNLSGKTAGAVAIDKILRIDWKDLARAGMASPRGMSFGLLDFGRDEEADEVWEKATENAKRIGTKEAYAQVKQALEDTTWKNLEKIVNWRKDNLSTADVRVLIKPPGGMTGQQFHERLRAVFGSYQNNVPYGPTTAYGPAMNSNSFAFSLMRVAYGGLPPELEKIASGKRYPGLNKNVPMKAPVNEVDDLGRLGQRSSKRHTPWSEGALDALQFSLGVLGFAPGIGEPFDLVNAAISTKRRKPLEAVLNAASVLPGVDVPAKGAIILLRALERGVTTIRFSGQTYGVAELGHYLLVQFQKLPLKRLLEREQIALIERDLYPLLQGQKL